MADAQIAAYEQRQGRAYDQSNAEYDKCERYCRKQRELLRLVADLNASERAMYELDHAKDQVMTALKLALVNLVMWTRDRYFPATYAASDLEAASTLLPLVWADRVGQRHRAGGPASLQ